MSSRGNAGLRSSYSAVNGICFRRAGEKRMKKERERIEKTKRSAALAFESLITLGRVRAAGCMTNPGECLTLRDTHRERDREIERGRHRERERETHTERERERERDRDRD